MNRRQALHGIVISTLALMHSATSTAQSNARVTVIGLLDAGERLAWWDSFQEEFHKLGYVEGQNVSFEKRYAKGNLDSLPALARELVQRKVAVIVTGGAAAAVAAQRATRKIPIVMASGTDQVSLGLAENLARPGGNVTGLSSINSELMAKRFEMLRRILPKSSKLAVLWHADNAPSMASVRDLEASAGQSRIAFQSFGIRSGEELPDVFSAMTRERVDALVVVNNPFIYGERKGIFELALKHKIPTMYGAAEYVEAGGLLSYAPSYPEMFRHAATYVDKILKGAKPGDLPIEGPTRIELVINLKTARALGLTIPQPLLVSADRVIQ